MYLHERKSRWLRNTLARIAVLGSVYALGVYSVYDYAAEEKLKSYNKGFERGLRDTSWKERALQDHTYSRELCTAWWFGAKSSERRLK